jgi:hypothetical protein
VTPEASYCTPVGAPPEPASGWHSGRAVRRLALLVALAALAASPAATGIVGGSAVDVRNAPWSVLVLQRTGDGGSLCSGAIIDATHVLTAAHCVVENGTPAPASTLTVRAGVTNAAAPSATDSLQDRQVTSVRVHGGYVQGSKTGGDDVAVLALGAPLDLNGPTARAIALPGPSTALKLGDGVSLAGYGLKTVSGTIDGTLNGMNGTLVDQSACLPPAYDTANGVLLCAFSGSSSPCSGDSGSALVLTAPTPILVGVTRAASCSSNSVASYANVTAPEILQFIQGNDNPPMAPRPQTTSTLKHPTPIMQVGQTVTCMPGGWSGSPALSYEFREGTNDDVLQSGDSSGYRLRDADAGRTLLCRVLAANAGGTTFDESAPTVSPVVNAPDVSVEPTTASRGGTATIRVQLVDWVRPFGKVDVCVTFAPRVGGRLCRAATPAGATPTVVMRLKLKRTAPPDVRARASVTARAADGRSAGAAAFVAIR